MAEQTGAKIKEARLAAGMTQKDLAEAVDGLSATKISEAERGLRELSDEELAAIAEATGSESLLGEAGEETPEAIVEETEAPAIEEETADNPEPEAKSEGQQDQSLTAAAGALGGAAGGKNPLGAVMGVVGSLDADEVAATAKDAVENLDADEVAATAKDAVESIDADAVAATAKGAVESLDEDTVASVAGTLGSMLNAVKG